MLDMSQQKISPIAVLCYNNLMRLFSRIKVYPLIVLIFAAITLQACSFIAGKEDRDLSAVPLLNLRFVETLKNQESLRGESYRELNATSSATSLQRPASVYADQFRVYVTDAAVTARIFIFNRSEGTVSILNLASSSVPGEEKQVTPSAVAVDISNKIFVSDARQGRVFEYDRNGKLLMVLGRPLAIASQTSISHLGSPSALAVNNANNRIYVADSGGQQVSVFNTMGLHLFDIGKSGRTDEDFRFPVAVALDRAGNVYVVDSLRRSVHVFTPDGVFLRSFDMKSAAPMPADSIKPSGIAVDSDGHIYVTDAVNNDVLIFNNDGSFLTKWGRNGRLFGDFWTPAGIFIDNNDFIYIADQTNNRIQTFQYLK